MVRARDVPVMPEFVVVTWDRTRVAAAQAVVSGEQVRLVAGWWGTWPEGQVPALNPTAAGAWLRDEWQKHGLTAASVWAVLQREDVVLRYLELPQAPDDELADLVKFQAAARSSVPIEQVALDFLPLPARADRPHRDALAATIPRAGVETIRNVLAAAGRDLAGVSFSSMALAEWVARQDRRRNLDAAADLVIGFDGQRVELAVLADKQLTFGHAARLSAEADVDAVSAIAAEINRTSVVVQRLHPNLQLKHGWLIGGDAALSRALAERLEMTLDAAPVGADLSGGALPRGLEGHPTEAVVLLGAALSRSHAVAPGIDFLRPRQPPPKRDPRKQQRAIGSAAALLALFLVSGGVVARVEALKADIIALQNEGAEYDNTIAAGKKPLQLATAVQEWVARDRHQIQQIVELEAALPGGRQRPYFSQYVYTAGAAPATGAAPGAAAGSAVLGKLSGSLAARQREDIEGFRQALSDLGHYVVRPRAVEQRGSDPDYPFLTALDADVTPKRKEPPAAPKAAKPPES